MHDESAWPTPRGSLGMEVYNGGLGRSAAAFGAGLRRRGLHNRLVVAPLVVALVIAIAVTIGLFV